LAGFRIEIMKRLPKVLSAAMSIAAHRLTDGVATADAFARRSHESSPGGNMILAYPDFKPKNR
jgi:hypothetical protein